ncbi:hypothetical protein [Halanaerobacter jeridensis]|uniref:hypothetical protein n=1 Tax=Halanaerobacter jeridensis TaxID=706427 RepID=UPI001959ED13|nr:hypothetical protein [Halanaerobacter jeridensis]
MIEFIKHVKNDTVTKNNLAIGYARNEVEYLGQEVSYSKELELESKRKLRLEITIKDLEGIEYYREEFSGVAIPKSDNSDDVNNLWYSRNL